ncbi:MAG: T9SS type A sorting domain-containing protein [Ignavibacteria bacterium]|nr:T9SS type A sorting domain-containing protein [Ignavibacteria bacterium]
MHRYAIFAIQLNILSSIKLRNLTKILSIFVLLAAITAFAQDNARIMTYNLLNYPDVDSAIRNPRFRTVINSSNPDILVVQEMTSQAGMNGFLSSVMNAYGNFYSMGTFIDGTDTDNGIFYKTAKFRFISNTRIRTALRDINEFKIIHISYPADTLRIYSVHLKSSSGVTNENLRAAEVDSLRKFTASIPADKFYMVVGDFNIYGDTEPAYFKLKQINGNGFGHFTDVINMPGVWNQFQYRQYHTQSPRTRAFGGGSTGGMDDRFDMILFSPGIFNAGRIAYVPGTMTAYGNDGNHYNDSINRRPNTAVADSVADAIHYASDHIPVYATFTFGNVIGISGNQGTIPQSFSLGQNYPNPFNPATKIKYDVPLAGGFTKLIIYDLLGREVATLVNAQLPPGSYEAMWNASNHPSGVYLYTLTAGEYRETKKMILLK